MIQKHDFANKVGYDVFGRKLEIGDLVFIFTAGYSGEMIRRVGTVAKFTEKKTTISTTPRWGWRGAEKANVSVDPKNVIKIDQSCIDSLEEYIKQNKKE